MAEQAVKIRSIALVAHDNMKDEMLEWSKHNRDLLSEFELYATGTTGGMLEKALKLPINRMQSGPLGGDQQIGAKIAWGEIDMLIFFWDPLSPQPHDPDVKAVQRMAVVWNIPLASNRSTADFLITSPLLRGGYQQIRPDFETYEGKRELPTIDGIE
jgi:methylglyoxal synthase